MWLYSMITYVFRRIFPQKFISSLIGLDRSQTCRMMRINFSHFGIFLFDRLSQTGHKTFSNRSLNLHAVIRLVFWLPRADEFVMKLLKRNWYNLLGRPTMSRRPYIISLSLFWQPTSNLQDCGAAPITSISEVGSGTNTNSLLEHFAHLS